MRSVIDRLIERAKKTPFTHIGNYMERYWLRPYVPDDAPWYKQWACRIHHILRSDEADAVHNHPWNFITIILRGGYYEWRLDYVDPETGFVYAYRKWHGPGSILFRRYTDYHRLEVPEGVDTWTLFFTGKYRHSWSFLPHMDGTRPIPYREYLGLPPKICMVVQHSDQMVCHQCGTAWDMNDPCPPKCGRVR